ncbi:MAG: WD40 repeat domain-containing serine/threonine protein kinase [Pirellulaceae bacterium]|nr:WD40 repeat domain-containing serine/threonine protein kinase [Pirellulaceae bacterium]
MNVFRAEDQPHDEKMMGLASEIRELFPTLQWMEQCSSGSYGGVSRRHGSAADAVCPPQLGEYRVVRRIGRGGMGTVYEAVQESLGRRVALKVLSPRDAENATLLERFKREAQAAASLHHTNIVPVFGVGESGGVHFYAMQYIEGQSLDRLLAEAASGETPSAPTALAAADASYYRAVARIGVQAADALAYAHAEGVLHRDVKPANMLLDSHGTLWLSDFGLARIEGLGDLTVAEDVVGTLRYVPPERFEGRTDARGDVYSLGLTLYEFLTRRPAFDTTTRAELVHQILHRPPLPPRRIDPRIPRDLETVVLKAISREPERRYASAAAMAEDLRRYLSDRPVSARRLTGAERSWRWCRKNRFLAGASAVAVLMLLATAVVSTLAYFRENQLRTDVQLALQRAQQAEADGRREVYGSYVSAVQASQVSRRQGQRWDSLSAIGKAARLLPALTLPAAESRQRREELRDLAISALTLPDVRELVDLPPSGVVLDPFHLDRSMERLSSGALVVRQWPAGTELARLPNVDESVVFTFTPERDTVLLLDRREHNLQRWQIGAVTPTPVAQVRQHDGSLRQHDFSRDGRRLLLVHHVGDHRLVEVLDWPAGHTRFSREWLFDEDLPCAARLSPDGQRLAMIEGSYRAENSELVRVIDVDGGRELALLPHSASVESIAWHPDSQTLAVGLTDSNDVVLWNVVEHKQLRVLTDQRGGGPQLVVNATGELLCSFSSWANQLDLWHPYSGKPVLHTASATQFEWAVHDGRLLGNQRLANGWWRFSVVEPSPVVRTLVRNPMHGRGGKWWDVSIHPSGRLMAVGSDNGVSLFDLQTGQDVGYLPVGHAASPWFVPATGDLLTYSPRGLLRWPVHFSEQDPSRVTVGAPGKLPCPAAFGTQVTSDRSGRVIAAATGKTAVVVHDGGKEVVTLGPLPDCRRVAVSPDGRWVVTVVHGPGPLDVWDARSGALVHQLSAQTDETYVCFHPDGQWVACEQTSPRLVHTATWQEQQLPEVPGIGFRCFSPDGQLAIDLHRRGATLREFRTGRKLGTLSLPDLPSVWHATFTPDGTGVVLSSNEQRVCYVWDLRRLSEELAALGLDWDSPHILPAPTAPSSDGRTPLTIRIVDGEIDAPSAKDATGDSSS